MRIVLTVRNGFGPYQPLQPEITHVKNCCLITARSVDWFDNIKKGAKKE